MSRPKNWYEFFLNKGTFLQEKVLKADFSDENIYLTKNLLGSSANRMTPSHFSKLCGTTGFLIFFIKDMLEYAGILLERKINNLRIYKNMQYEEYRDKITCDKIEDFAEALKAKL